MIWSQVLASVLLEGTHIAFAAHSYAGTSSFPHQCGAEMPRFSAVTSTLQVRLIGEVRVEEAQYSEGRKCRWFNRDAEGLSATAKVMLEINLPCR